MKRPTLEILQRKKASGEPIASMTAYDATFAAALERSGIDFILVGDSLGMVIQGGDSTLGVTVGDIAYHCRCVHAGAPHTLLVADMPFMSYATIAQALGNAARLLREGNAQMVKMEGGGWLAETVQALDDRGIPVCGHLGLLPQSVHKLGGYKVQGRDEQSAAALLEEARILEQVGARLLVLECVPAALAAQVSRELSIPVIGIGAGAEVDGQVLVLHDALGMNPSMPRFCRDFLAGTGGIEAAFRAYVAAVRERSFPSPEEAFD